MAMARKFEKMTVNQILGNNLRLLRESRVLTQEEVAYLLYVNRSTYTYWENGKHQPDLATLVHISEIFEVSLQDLLSGIEDALKE